MSPKKAKVAYECPGCGYYYRSRPKELRCTACGKYVRQVKSRENNGIFHATTKPMAVSLGDCAGSTTSEKTRIPIPHDPEFHRVMGGGLVIGTTTLFTGEPGIGKSSLMLGLCDIATDDFPVLYLSGEESVTKIQQRAKRLGLDNDNIFVANNNDLGLGLDIIERYGPKLIVLDSIQVFDFDGPRGLPSTMERVAHEMSQFANKTGVIVIMIGHVTKSGDIGGPEFLQHIVDIVINLSGDPYRDIRLLRSTKNRHAATNEIGTYLMFETGLSPIKDLAGFYNKTSAPRPGRAIHISLEGSRPIIVEIQASVLTVSHSNKKIVSGIPVKKVDTVASILQKQLGVEFAERQIIVKTVGGFEVKEPAVDLALAVAMMSSEYNIPLPSSVCFSGELGLDGSILKVSMPEVRQKEAKNVGFAQSFIAAKSDAFSIQDIEEYLKEQ